MSDLEEDAKNKAASTYNAASDYYDHPANTFWGQFGRRTLTRLGLGQENRSYMSYRTDIVFSATFSNSSRIRHPAIPCPLPLAKAPESC